MKRQTRREIALEEAQDELLTQRFVEADTCVKGWKAPERNALIDKAFERVASKLTADGLVALQDLIYQLGRAAEEEHGS